MIKTKINNTQVEVKKIMTKANNTMKEVQYIRTKSNNNMVKIYDVLPNEYQRTEYTQSHPTPSSNFEGGPVISLPTQPLYFDTIEMDFVWDNAYSSYNMNFVLIGGRKSRTQSSVSWCVRLDSDGVLRLWYGALINTSFSPVVGTKYHLKVYAVDGTQEVYVDGVLVGTGNVSYDMSTQNHTTIFGHYFNGSRDYEQFNTCLAAKMYKVKLYKNNNLIYSLVPCYEKSSLVIGMYDLVGGAFYTKQGNKGYFTKGENI